MWSSDSILSIELDKYIGLEVSYICCTFIIYRNYRVIMKKEFLNV